MQRDADVVRGGRGVRARAPRLVIDPERLRLDDSTIVVSQTRDGGYVCLAFGAAGDFLDAVENDRTLDQAIAKRQADYAKRDSDPFLDRLATAVALAKDYDQNQPRDDDGRWTSGGGSGTKSPPEASGSSLSGAAAGAVAIADTATVFGNPYSVQALKEIAARALAAIVAVLPDGAAAAGLAIGGAALVFRTLFVPTNKDLGSSGTLPDAPDFAYRYDLDTGRLTVTRQNEDGTTETVFSGHHGADAVFRDENGRPIGRFLGDSVALDADAIRGYEARRKSDSVDQAGAAAQSIARARTDAKLCPDPTVESIAGRKLPALLYQSQISGLPPGVDFRLVDPATGRDVSYDACWPAKQGEMGEAKGPNYFKFMIDPDHWYKWYQGVAQIKDQMERQARAAGARHVEWHFAEQGPADYFRRYVEANPLTLSNVHVFYTPPINQPSEQESRKVRK
jgi:hypothetical protein